MKRSWNLFLIVIIAVSKGASQAKECTSRGNFPYDQENNCNGFTMCLIAGVGKFNRVNLNCPDGFIFNHYQGHCTNVTIGYECEPQFNCTEIGIGNFSNPYNDDCNSYIACIEGFSEVITARIVACPEQSSFSTDVQSCVNRANHCKKLDTHLERVLDHEKSTENSAYCVKSLASSLILIYSIIISIL